MPMDEMDEMRMDLDNAYGEIAKLEERCEFLEKQYKSAWKRYESALDEINSLRKRINELEFQPQVDKLQEEKDLSHQLLEWVLNEQGKQKLWNIKTHEKARESQQVPQGASVVSR